jgi:hypothetical protein
MPWEIGFKVYSVFFKVQVPKMGLRNIKDGIKIFNNYIDTSHLIF